MGKGVLEMKHQLKIFNSISTKTLFFISLALILTVLATVGFTMYNLTNYAETVALQDAVRGMEGLATQIEELKVRSYQNAQIIAENPLVIQGLESNASSVQLQQIIGGLSITKSLDFVTITNNRGIVLLRTHEPKNTGDNISKQQNVQMALKNQPIAVVEAGTAIKLSARAGIPVKNAQGNIVGVISTGYSLEKPEFLAKIKDNYDTDVTLFLGDTRFNTTIMQNGKYVIGTQLDAEIATQVLKAKQKYVGKADILGIPYLTSYMPLLGFNNEALGVIFAGQPVVAAYKMRDNIAAIVVALTIILLALVVVLIAVYLRKSIINPIKNMVKCAHRLALGDTDIQIENTSQDEIGTLLSAFSEMAANIKDTAEVASKIAEGNLDVEVRIKSPQDILSLSINEVKDSLTKLAVEFNGLIEGMVQGSLDLRGDSSQFHGAYYELMIGLNEALGSIVNNFEVMETPIMFTDKDFNIRYMNQYGARMFGKTKLEMVGKKCYDVWQTSSCKTAECPCAKAMTEDGVTNTESTVDIGSTTIDIMSMGAPLKNKAGQIIGAFELITDQTAIKDTIRKNQKIAAYQNEEVSKLVANLKKLANGQLDIHQTVAEGDTDTSETKVAFTQIAQALNLTVESLRGYISEISKILMEIAQGNLVLDITGDYRGDFNDIKTSLNLIINSLNDIIGNFGMAANQVAAGSNQVADSSQMLSQGSAEQASTMQEITASVTQIAAQTRQNAANASQANEFANGSKEQAITGNQQMAELVEAMEAINQASNNIYNIIKVIDGIAFQTNILSLNAAVEAARAGQHGKGFAVVAEEVRNLAGRSADAAKETTELIEGTIKKVEMGFKLANQTANALNQIVDEVTKTTNLVGEIAIASNEQATGIAQINQGISQVAEVTQSITATSEEGAAASEELSSQAMLLKEMVDKFKTKSSNQR